MQKVRFTGTSRLRQSLAQSLHSLESDERFYHILNVFKIFFFNVLTPM